MARLLSSCAWVLLALSAWACRSDRVFYCVEGAQCRTYDPSGVCEAPVASDAGQILGPTNEGACNFADPACPSGHRWAASSGGVAAGCVPCGGADEDCCTAVPSCASGLRCGGSLCTCVASLALSDGQTCVLKASGDITCIGYAVYQPDGTSTPSYTAPVSIDGLHATAFTFGFVVADGMFDEPVNCATDDTATTRCWADNTPAYPVMLPPPIRLGMYAGQLCGLGADGALSCANGQGGTASTLLTDVVTFGTLSGSLTTGFMGPVASGHLCAVKTDGSVSCVGSNTYGQLGDGTTMDAPTPVRANVGLATSVAVSSFDSCAALRDGTVWCWGGDSEGVVGPFSTPMPNPTPVKVQGLTDIVQVVTNGTGHCARSKFGQVSCWDLTDPWLAGGVSATPILLTTLPEGIEEIALAPSVACARKGVVTYCWGASNGASPLIPSTPGPVPLTCP